MVNIKGFEVGTCLGFCWLSLVILVGKMPLMIHVVHWVTLVSILGLIWVQLGMGNILEFFLSHFNRCQLRSSNKIRLRFLPNIVRRVLGLSGVFKSFGFSLFFSLGRLKVATSLGLVETQTKGARPICQIWVHLTIIFAIFGDVILVQAQRTFATYVEG